MAETAILNNHAASNEYLQGLQNIGWKLLPYFDTTRWQPRHADLLRTKIHMKVDQIRYEIHQRQAQYIQRPSAILPSWLQAQYTQQPVTQTNTQIPPSWPPAPPVHAWSTAPVHPPPPPPKAAPIQQIMPTKLDQAMSTWVNFDIETQSKVFRAQLRSAKSPKALMHEMAMFWDEKYEIPAGLPSGVSQILQATHAWTYLSSLVEKVQAPLNTGTREARMDSCTIPALQGTSKRIAQQSTSNVQSTTTHRTAKDSRMAAGCYTRTPLESRDQNKSREQLSATKESSSQEKMRSRKESKNAYPSEITCTTRAKCAPEDKCLSKDVGTIQQIIRTASPQDELIRTPDKDKGLDDLPRTAPMQDLATILEERMRAANLKRARKAEEEKSIQNHKRIKLENDLH